MPKFNMSPKKNPMPSQAPDVRNKNFEEVALGYSEETAIDEAKRCLGCKNRPCVNGCPVNIHIPEFIAKVAEGDFEGAYEVISLSSSLPAVCGRVCPQESQCESKCTLGIKFEPVGIGRLERFVADIQQVMLHAVVIRDHAAHEHVAASGHFGDAVGNVAAGAALGGAEGEAAAAERFYDFFG